MVALLAAMIFAALGFLIYFFMQRNVPEVIDFFEGTSHARGMGEESFSSEDSEPDYSAQSDKGFNLEEETGKFASSEESTPEPVRPKKPDGNYGDHIIVDNVPIRNEPKLMAEAIRTMMANDSE